MTELTNRCAELASGSLATEGVQGLAQAQQQVQSLRSEMALLREQLESQRVLMVAADQTHAGVVSRLSQAERQVSQLQPAAAAQEVAPATPAQSDDREVLEHKAKGRSRSRSAARLAAEKDQAATARDHSLARREAGLGELRGDNC